MGIFDEIQLLEPLPCYRCFSTIEDKLGTNERRGTVTVAGKELPASILPGGRGGIKNFQTYDLTDTMSTYYFPGFIPKDDYNDRTISLIEICNVCETCWEGELHVTPYEEDGILLMETIDIWPKDQSLETVLNQREGLYNVISLPNHRIRITPNDIKIAIEEYNKRAERYKSNAETIRIFLESFKDPKVPTNKIIGHLEEYIRSRRKVSYKNRLAQAITDYTTKAAISIHNEMALKTALVILYHYNNEKALELVDRSGIEAKEDFLKDLGCYEWFFLNESELTPKQRRGSTWGIVDGVNSYLYNISK